MMKTVGIDTFYPKSSLVLNKTWKIWLKPTWLDERLIIYHNRLSNVSIALMYLSFII